MTTCQILQRAMLIQPVCVHLEEMPNDLEAARRIADEKALKRAADPMLLAWYEARTGRFSPNVACCSETKPGWLVYAESRGGNITIDINDEAYVFVYRDAAQEPPKPSGQP